MDENINIANDLIRENNFKEAVEILEGISDSIEALKLLGLCYINLNDIKSALNAYKTVVEYSQDDATSWYYLAICYDNLEDYSNAELAYNKVIELREKYIDAYKNLGIIYLKTSQFKKAVEIANKGIELDCESYLFYFLGGTALLSLKEYKDSLPYFEKAIELEPNNIQLYFNYGTAFLSMQEYDKALSAYKTALEINPNNPFAHFNCASVYQILQNEEETLKHYRKAYELDESELFMSSLALAEYKAGNYKEALEYYGKLSSLYPEKQNYKYNLVCCYEKIGDIKTAINILEQCLELNPKSKLIINKIAGLYIENRQYDKAKLAYEKLISSGYVSDDIYYDYAFICSKIGDVDAAERFLKKVLDLNSNYAKAHKDLGVIYLSKRLFDYAEDEFKKAYEIAPENGDIVFEYANFLQAIKKNQEAKMLYEKAVSLNPKEPNYYIFAALNCQILKDLRNAVKYIEAAVKLIPEDAFILLNAGRIYYAAKKYDKAQFVLVKSWELNQNVEVENLLGLTYFAQKEYEKSYTVFEKLSKENPMNTNILLNFAKSCEKSGRLEQAKTAASKLLEIFEDMPEAKRLLNRIKKLEKKV